MELRLTDWLPTTRKEMELRGWEEADVILFSGDAYVDHPSFGISVIGRVLEAEGLRVAIVPQPDWHGDYRDFKKLGRPRLFFGVSAGNMDSMVNRYTAGKRLRSDDAYSPDGRPALRPDYPSIVYTQILKELYPDVPVVLGGIEASMRRLSHYDYWQDKLLPGILSSSGADLLIYGMGEEAIRAIARRLQGMPLPATVESVRELTDIPQTVYLASREAIVPQEGDIRLHSYEECLKEKRFQAQNFRHIEEESNKLRAARLLQDTGNGYTTVVNPPYPPMETEQLDAIYDLPYTRMPHPKYRGKRIAAYEMIRHSVTIHRGCFGGCAFCTISAHQGKFIVSRSKASILREVRQITRMPDFKGYVSDLGGPSANMYRMGGIDKKRCARCAKPSCIHPSPCPNLNVDYAPLIDLYQSVDAIPGVKKSFIGSGIRYDLLLSGKSTGLLDKSAATFLEELLRNHVSGRLKVAPEHTADPVLQLMRKPSFRLFEEFQQLFEQIDKRYRLNQQLIPYFISSHPGCREADMAELAVRTKELHFHLQQVQDFTPTPMSLSTEIYYTGLHPYTLQPVHTARSREEKEAQRQFFFWYKPEMQGGIARALLRIGRKDLIGKLFPGGVHRGEQLPGQQERIPRKPERVKHNTREANAGKKKR